MHLLGQASSGKPRGCQEQPIVNKVCIQFEYITKDRLKVQSTCFVFVYKQKDEPTPVAPTDLY